MKHNFDINQTLLCLTRDDPNVDHSKQVETFVESGFNFIQLRSKSLGSKDLLNQAKRSVEIAKAYGCTLIINDYYELAQEVDADGVHLGWDDASISVARSFLNPDKIIGKTVHSLEQATETLLDCPDYIGVGPYRKSSTKEELSPTLSDHEFAQIFELLLPIPVYLIGGLKSDDHALIEKFGIQGIAICSELFSGDSLSGHTQKIFDRFHSFQSISV